MRQLTKCRCSGNAVFQNGTVLFEIGSRTICIHNVPHYKCSSCKRVIYGKVPGLVQLLQYASRNELVEIDYLKGAEVLITFLIDVDDQTKKEIEEAVLPRIGGIDDGEEFVIVSSCSGLAYLGNKAGDQLVITKIVSKII